MGKKSIRRLESKGNSQKATVKRQYESKDKSKLTNSERVKSKSLSQKF